MPRWSRTTVRLRLAAAALVILLIFGVVIVLWAKGRRTRFPIRTVPAASPATTSAPSVAVRARRLEDRFGASNVATLNLTNLRGVRNLRELLEARMPVLVPSGQRASELTIGRTTSVKIAPVDSLDELARRIDFGTVTSIDRTRRIINVRVDPAKLTPPSGDTPPRRRTDRGESRAF